MIRLDILEGEGASASPCPSLRMPNVVEGKTQVHQPRGGALATRPRAALITNMY